MSTRRAQPIPASFLAVNVAFHLNSPPYFTLLSERTDYKLYVDTRKHV